MRNSVLEQFSLKVMLTEAREKMIGIIYPDSPLYNE